jgi:ABC-type multidrug transport system fused ATPase/permease subunit
MIVAFLTNWQLTLILLLILPIAIGGAYMFAEVCVTIFINQTSYKTSQCTANETLNELNTYSKASQITQDVFSSFRTVLSLNGGLFEQER